MPPRNILQGRCVKQARRFCDNSREAFLVSCLAKTSYSHGYSVQNITATLLREYSVQNIMVVLLWI